MQFGNKLLAGVFAGLVLGIVVGVTVLDLSYGNACPSRICVGSADVVPVSDRGYFGELHKALAGAKKSIHIAAFEFKYYPNYGNSSMNVIVNDLIEAKRRGVDVKVVVDEYSDRDNAYDVLAANGVEIKYDSNSTTTHAKLFIVDGEIVILGSTNLSYTSFEKNNEVNVLIRDGRVAGYFESYFRRLWESS